jgi:hypothetical protein
MSPHRPHEEDDRGVSPHKPISLRERPAPLDMHGAENQLFGREQGPDDGQIAPSNDSDQLSCYHQQRGFLVGSKLRLVPPGRK